jgi:hypothetical protein
MQTVVTLGSGKARLQKVCALTTSCITSQQHVRRLWRHLKQRSEKDTGALSRNSANDTVNYSRD